MLTYIKSSSGDFNADVTIDFSIMVSAPRL